MLNNYHLNFGAVACTHGGPLNTLFSSNNPIDSYGPHFTEGHHLKSRTFAHLPKATLPVSRFSCVYSPPETAT